MNKRGSTGPVRVSVFPSVKWDDNSMYFTDVEDSMKKALLLFFAVIQ